MDKNINKKLASNWFKILQDIICKDIEEIENKKNIFNNKKWSRGKNKGGGEIRIFENGKVFDS